MRRKYIVKAYQWYDDSSQVRAVECRLAISFGNDIVGYRDLTIVSACINSCTKRRVVINYRIIK
jgi:hypothetical protein